MGTIGFWVVGCKKLSMEIFLHLPQFFLYLPQFFLTLLLIKILYLEYCESARKVDLELVLMEMTLEEVEWLSQFVSPAREETRVLKQIPDD